jgi:hypothetical protein
MFVIENEKIPIDYFYINVAHEIEARPFFKDEGDFGDYLLLLRYRSGKFKIWGNPNVGFIGIANAR